ncbi:MAG: DUF4282 domain-containing protein, partial [Gallionellaceae bacterium]|nr:DUF4282 domain-containing protein [Gallionellaceae bacterium]
FDKMLTPIIIKVIYYLGLAGVGISAIVLIIAAFRFNSLMSFIYAIVTLVFGSLMVRVYCELMILAFRIYDKLVDINNAQAKNG